MLEDLTHQNPGTPDSAFLQVFLYTLIGEALQFNVSPSWPYALERAMAER